MTSALSPLPSYVYDRIVDLATALKEASLGDDEALAEECYGELRDYCMAFINEGNEWAYLWETLGDFTADDEQALEFYEAALAAAERNEEEAYSILIGMGERHASAERVELARELLSRGLHLAMEAGDSDMAARADVLLAELPL